MAAKHYGPNPKVVPNCASGLGIANPAWNSDLHSPVLGLLLWLKLEQNKAISFFSACRFRLWGSKAATVASAASPAPSVQEMGKWDKNSLIAAGPAFVRCGLVGCKQARSDSTSNTAQKGRTALKSGGHNFFMLSSAQGTETFLFARSR